MNRTAFRGISYLVLFGIIFTTSNLLLGGNSYQLKDTTSYFLYIDFYGTRYNQSTQRLEYYIKAVKLPVHLLKRIPKLKNYGQFSQKNIKTYLKQQDIIRPFRGNNLNIRIDQNKLKDFYPEGLKKGFIIEESEYSRWDFIERPREHVDPIRYKPNNQIELYWDDLLNNASIVIDNSG